jgi:hypothetical protein
VDNSAARHPATCLGQLTDGALVKSDAVEDDHGRLRRQGIAGVRQGSFAAPVDLELLSTKEVAAIRARTTKSRLFIVGRI